MSERVPVPTVVAIGGGHGLAATLRALRTLPVEPTAVVSVADDGGSTGRLRAASERAAPGDIRKCLVALATSEGPLTKVMEHRFESGELAGHSFGNLLLAALEESEGTLLRSVDAVADLLEVEGRVLPATEDVVELVATLGDGREVSGQAAVSSTSGVCSVELRPSCEAPVEVLNAITSARAILLGPGSLYTSVLAAAVVPDIRAAVEMSQAPLIYVCNLRPQAEETDGYDVAAHVGALARHGFEPDVVIYDPSTMQPGAVSGAAQLVATPLATSNGRAHDTGLLADALGSVLAVCSDAS